MSFTPVPCGGTDLGDVSVNNGSGAAAVNIQDGGNSITVDGIVTPTTSHIEDLPHVSGDIGDFALGVRNDNGVTTLTDTNGDYSPIATDLKGRIFTTTAGCSITNGVETAVSSTAVQIVASGVGRKGLMIQNNGTGDVRIGATGVTATTGIKLIPGDSIILTGGATPVNAVFAIRSAAVDSIVLAQELI